MIIGITGGIGSGKSTIAKELAKRGYSVYDCDREAKRIINSDPQVQKQIIALLGEEAFIDGQYNTAYVSSRVFADSKLLEQLNGIIHPAVCEDIKNSLPYREGMGVGPFFIESAILFESGLNQLCDKIVVVDAPEDVRIARVIARDYNGNATEDNIAKVRARINAQQFSFAHHAALHILNDGQTPIKNLVDLIDNSIFIR